MLRCLAVGVDNLVAVVGKISRTMSLCNFRGLLSLLVTIVHRGQLNSTSIQSLPGRRPSVVSS